MIIYAISDIHGYLDIFNKTLELIDLSGDNKLVLLGDYIHMGPDGYGVLDRIMALEEQYGTDKVIALLGNHEEWVIQGRCGILDDTYKSIIKKNIPYVKWFRKLKKYYAVEKTIFVHAGVCEEEPEYWKFGTTDDEYTNKYPPENGDSFFGPFYGSIKIVAGHNGTHGIAEYERLIHHSDDFNEILYDGKAHYYIDATVEYSKKLNVIKVDTETDKYYEVTETGEKEIMPLEKMTDFWED